MSAALVIARLGLHVVDADDLSLRLLCTGWYAVPTREALPVESCVVGPFGTADEAGVALAERLAEIQWSRSGLATGAAS